MLVLQNSLSPDKCLFKYTDRVIGLSNLCVGEGMVVVMMGS